MCYKGEGYTDDVLKYFSHLAIDNYNLTPQEQFCATVVIAHNQHMSGWGEWLADGIPELPECNKELLLTSEMLKYLPFIKVQLKSLNLI